MFSEEDRSGRVTKRRHESIIHTPTKVEKKLEWKKQQKKFKELMKNKIVCEYAPQDKVWPNRMKYEEVLIEKKIKKQEERRLMRKLLSPVNNDSVYKEAMNKPMQAHSLIL